MIVSGSYLESAAYNPSIPPLQAALLRAIAIGRGPKLLSREEMNSDENHNNKTDENKWCWRDIVLEAVLVERPDGDVRQQESLRAMMKVIAPEATIRVIYDSFYQS